MNTDREPDGYLMADDPETDLLSPLAYWLPDGVTAADLGMTPDGELLETEAAQ